MNYSESMLTMTGIQMSKVVMKNMLKGLSGDGVRVKVNWKGPLIARLINKEIADRFKVVMNAFARHTSSRLTRRQWPPHSRPGYEWLHRMTGALAKSIKSEHRRSLLESRVGTNLKTKFGFHYGRFWEMEAIQSIRRFWFTKSLNGFMKTMKAIIGKRAGGI